MGRPGRENPVTPYWELTFDADGDVDGQGWDRLLAEVIDRGVNDLIVFAHGWNNDSSGATSLYRRFFEPIPQLAQQARIGYVGVIWPSMRFSDEPTPPSPTLLRGPTAKSTPRPALAKDTRHALLETFPGRATVIDQITRMLDQQPPEEAALEEFGRLVRLLVQAAPSGPQALFAADTIAEGVPQDEPEIFAGSAAAVCEEFAQALALLESPDGAAAFAIPNPWDGAHELLRQGTYFAMKQRAGTVGERGLGPVIGQLATAAPGVRVHLVGHSFGGRLVSFALRGLPQGVRTVKSVTLLQGAFSHYAFASRLPHDPRAGGVLQGQQNRIDGPLLCCYSHFDSALGTMYPLASRIVGDARGVSAFDIDQTLGAKSGAMGHDGVQAVPGTKTFKLVDALKTKLPMSGCVNVDAAAVVKRGEPPAGAHSDIMHPELARLVLSAGRIR
ncbi:serine-threonine protein kinase [Streptomyces sp. NBC_00140]|uniref:serine-threonine protein kinase n=1 Tax=Streptomyces sp. NBC_00140 TaxID=2975664 RepID=UPI002255B791|nr:serine-threonine protein kinase [Streptomyces sp. NBC_00140]MCX5336787.1 serine-threonine protein kinase [Streptomyces sp. NBC_00140]